VPEERGAIMTLAGLLEQRRKGVLEMELMKGDSGALFDIANNFDLRHRRADQCTDYNPAFLDWIFSWYLATMVPTDQLLTRQDDGARTSLKP